MACQVPAALARDDSDNWRKNTTMLPQYCKDRAKGNLQKWRSTFGEVAIHLHHYCSGLFSEQKARNATKSTERKYWLGEVVSSMRYVSSACSSTRCVLYPELQTRWGWALAEQGQVGEAVKHYQLAFQARSNYIPAYAKLSELYLEINQPEEARKVIEQGLKANPKSRSLQRRLNELGTSE